MVDVKREASYVTIFRNIIHTNHKTMFGFQEGLPTGITQQERYWNADKEV
jgi:hypothetical protein